MFVGAQASYKRRVRNAKKGLTQATRWRSHHGGWFWAVVIADLLLVAWVVALVFIALAVRIPFLNNRPMARAGEVLVDLRPFIMPFLFAAAGISIFYVWRSWTVVRAYKRRAMERPVDLVRTAGSIIDHVVGRDQTCRILIEGLHASGRRVHVLQGGVGSGKTAVLVELTKQFAKRNAIPVNVRLRDAQKDLDFTTMALTRFKEEINSKLISSADAERMFRELRRNDRIVVLADGLEEALIDSGEGESKDRDSIIRLAIRRAQDDGLPLVVTSRPHDPLRAMDAVIMELEPLGDGPALTYITEGANDRDQNRLSEMTRAVGVSNSPLYLQMIRRLYREANVLWRELAGPEDERRAGSLDSDEYPDRSLLRLRIFDKWCQALREGYMYQDYALTQELRYKAIECLSALATVGILEGGLQEIGFDSLVNSDRQPDRGERIPQTDVGHSAMTAPSGAAGDAVVPVGVGAGRKGSSAPALSGYQYRILKEVARRCDYREFRGRGPDDYDANIRDFWLDRLRLAATMGDELGLVEARRNSVRFRHSLMQAYLGSRYLCAAMEDDEYCRAAMESPGKELLAALVLASRVNKTGDGLPAVVSGVPMVERLRDCAGHLVQVRSPSAPDVYAAAFEIDSHDGGGRLDELARLAKEDWQNMQTDDILQRAAVDARVGLIRAMGEAAAARAAHRTAQRETRGRGTRHAGWARTNLDDFAFSTTSEVGATFNVEVGPVRGPRQNDIYNSLYEVAMVERDDALGLEIMKQMGLGGDEARTALPIACDEGWGDMTDGDGRARSLSAWLAPVLYSSARHPTGRALHTLRRCVDCLAMADPSHPKNQALQVEIALAQGFRHAANQRSDARRVELADSGKYQQKRTALFEQAHRALEGSVFWYSHVVLIQAMALLSLPAKPSRDKPGQGPASNPHSEVTAWLYSSSNRGHPFVQEAAALAVDALETQCPENYLWTDESTVTRQVGSSSEPGSLPADHWWWILPSAGWATLDPRAQRLVADIMLMLNLTARGDRTIQEERLRRANIATLPPCLAHSRDQLDVGRTVGSVRGASIVTACLPGCDFKLCPYPPKGALSYRSELSEGICRKLASDPGRAWWQKDVPHKDLREFWAKMAGRTLPRHGD